MSNGMRRGSRLLRLRTAEQARCERAETDLQGGNALAEVSAAGRLGHHHDAVGAGTFQLFTAAACHALSFAGDLVFHLLDDAVGVVLAIACEGVLRAGREGVANRKLENAAGHKIPFCWRRKQAM